MAERPEITSARERLVGLLPAALETMEDLLGSHSEGARLGAARDIMDRGGLPAATQVEHLQAVDLDSRIELVLGRLAKAREVAYKGADSLLEELGAPEVLEPTLFEGVHFTPKPELIVAGVAWDDDVAAEGEVVEEELGWWQASPSTT